MQWYEIVLGIVLIITSLALVALVLLQHRLRLRLKDPADGLPEEEREQQVQEM